MSRFLRLSLGACVAVAAVAFAAPATAAYTPRLVASGAGPETTVQLRFPDADDPTAKIALYVPGPYQLGTPAIGAEIGSARAVLIAKELGNTKVTLTGSVTATDPTSSSVRTVATFCTGVPTHDQVWMLTVSVGGTGQNPIQVPAFIDRTTGAEAALGGIKIQICFRSPDIPPAQGGQPLGGKVTEAELTVRNVLLTPATVGDYLWRGLFTPYRPGTGSPNAGGTVEAQSIVRVPTRATLRGKILVKKRKVRGKVRRFFSVRLTGTVTEGGTQIGGVTVQILRAGRRVKTAKTNETGSFAVRLVLKRTVVFRARAIAPERSTSCQQTPVAPAGCAGATVSRFTVSSGTLRVRMPKRR